MAAPDDRATWRARERGSLYRPALGAEREPRHSAGAIHRVAEDCAQTTPARPIDNWHRIGPDTFWWDGLTEMLLIELDVTAPVTAYGLSRADSDPVATVSGGPGTITLRGGPMLGVRLSDESAVTNARGLWPSSWRRRRMAGNPARRPAAAGTTRWHELLRRIKQGYGQLLHRRPGGRGNAEAEGLGAGRWDGGRWRG